MAQFQGLITPATGPIPIGFTIFGIFHLFRNFFPPSDANNTYIYSSSRAYKRPYPKNNDQD
ncbi:hypothetical protein DCC81_08780 [Chitinophaga parva]|uniref:Uncharacterized protein n=1 Tax=Chitinophaga parva TaxID=2169414 RepID=A0A2T7BPC4_9BACT|nr:hypothetical protein DCC81_08780 [Chitinophaga parva]